MPGFLTRTLLSLVPKDQQNQVKGLIQQRSIDDITIPYLRPNNTPQPVTVSDRERKDITCLVFIKSQGKMHYGLPQSVREANPWRLSRPFWNTTDIKYLLWSKFFNEVTLREAKQIVAREVCDLLYKYVYLVKEPIIGVKIVLFDGDKDTVVSPRILRDPWFDDQGFNGLRIDRRLLKSWGLKTGYIEKPQEPRQETQKPLSQEFDTKNLTADTLSKHLADIDIDLDQILRDCLVDSEDRLSIIENKSTRYRIKSRLRGLLASTRFKSLFCKFLTSKLGQSQFRRLFNGSDDKESLIKTIAFQIVTDFIDKEAKNS